MKSKGEVFNPDHLDCCIEIGDCRLENPPKELLDKLIGQPISDYKKNHQRFSETQRENGDKIPKKNWLSNKK